MALYEYIKIAYRQAMHQSKGIDVDRLDVKLVAPAGADVNTPAGKGRTRPSTAISHNPAEWNACKPVFDVVKDVHQSTIFGHCWNWHMFRKLECKDSAVRQVKITIDGIDAIVDEGEPVAAVMLRIAPFMTRSTPISGSGRAPYCMMGACFDCLVEIDGEPSTRSCLVQSRDGMKVRRQVARPDPAKDIAA